MTKEQAWRKLVEYVEKHPYCEMKIEFKDAMPYIAEEIKESIKFT